MSENHKCYSLQILFDRKQVTLEQLQEKAENALMKYFSVSIRTFNLLSQLNQAILMGFRRLILLGCSNRWWFFHLFNKLIALPTYNTRFFESTAK